METCAAPHFEVEITLDKILRKNVVKELTPPILRRIVFNPFWSLQFSSIENDDNVLVGSFVGGHVWP
jgi:hypothetical protein